jgi:hypothetical protein
MTLCIGALASVPVPLEPCIILCFDYKVSNDAWGSESEYKFHVLNEELVALIAGSPAKGKELAGLYQAHLGAVTLSKANGLNELRKPLFELKRRKAESYIWSRLAVSYQDFLVKGEKWFGKARVDRYLTAIEQHQPNVEMIIAGFIEGHPVLYQISRDDTGALELEQSTNVCLIGTGATTAAPALHARVHRPTTPMSQALYNAYEAKKIGESSPYVGEKTRMFLLTAPEPGSKQIRGKVVTENGEKALKRLYRQYGPKPMKTWPDLPADSFLDAQFKWTPI